jgi:hypothetical protein
VYIQREDDLSTHEVKKMGSLDLSTHEVKKMGSLDLSTAPAGRSSYMKYLSMTLRENLVKQLLSTCSEIWNSKPFEI